MKAKPTKKKSARKKATTKKAKTSLCKDNSRRRKVASKKEPRPYIPPKTAAELGIVCGAQVGEGKCGAPVLWFDYAIGERNHMAGFVCDEHRISNRVERLAVKKQSAATVG